MKSTLTKALCAVLLFLPTIASAAEAAHGGGAKKQSLVDVYMEGGIVMHFLLLCSIAMVWLIIDITMRTARKRMTPPADVATARQAFLAGDYVAAYQAMKVGTSPFCEVVRGALGSVGHGKDATEEAIYITVEKINSTLQTRINYLSVIGVCAPMIGLLGTVAGLTVAFGALGSSGADVGALACHIGEVLVATATGLLVAIPAFGSFYFLRNKLQGGIHNLQDESERLFRNAPYEYLQNADVGQEETFAALPNWIEAPEG